MSKRFATSDQHFFHARINELSKRPFDSLEEMHRTLIERWNATVGKNDTVFVLGDFAIDSKWEAGLEILSTLNGTKHLIAGNHDRCSATRRDFAKYQAAYLADGFASVSEFARVRVNGQNVMMSHFPYEGDHLHSDRYVQNRLRDLGTPLLCGHVHEQWATSGHQFNVGVDVHNFTPVSFDTIETWLNTLSVS